MRPPMDGMNADMALCDNCAHAMIAQGIGDSQKLIRCQYFERVMPFRVMKCTEHREQNAPSYYQMEKLAWTLRTTPGQPIGFVPPKREE